MVFEGVQAISTSLAARMDLCKSLYESGGGDANFRLQQRVTVRPSKSSGYDILDEHTLATVAHADTVVLAGGRFWPFLYNQDMEALGTDKVFRRIEFGARLVAPSTNDFFSAGMDGHDGNADPKWILHDTETGVEYRTFCYCREGEVVHTVDGSPAMRTCSGRADGPANGMSNVGFNCRVKDPELARALVDDGIFERCRHQGTFSSVPLDDPSLPEHYGTQAFAILKKGIELLFTQHPCLKGAITLSGPTIEGVGAYPVIDNALRVVSSSQPNIDRNLYVCGDSCGIFRGIVASMCSGHYVGLQICQSHMKYWCSNCSHDLLIAQTEHIAQECM